MIINVNKLHLLGTMAVLCKLCEYFNLELDQSRQNYRLSSPCLNCRKLFLSEIISTQYIYSSGTYTAQSNLQWHSLLFCASIEVRIHVKLAF